MAIVDPNDYYFHYKGSINYPECEEDILWYVFEEE
jgi:carbonic anhydrase